MNKRKAKRFTIKNPFSRLIVYVDTDDQFQISILRRDWKRAFPWWKFGFGVIFVPMGLVEVVRV